MKTLLVLRHAKSSWDHPGLSDHDRPLNGRGEKDAPRMGKLLKKRNLVPDLIISSTALRAKQTAEAVAEKCGYVREIEFTEQFFHAPPHIYLQKLATVDEQHHLVMVVGHNPGLEDLVNQVTQVQEIFTTANLAWIELPVARWADVTLATTGILRQLWRPKELE
jgi:phosphohistidine phosphatase